MESGENMKKSELLDLISTNKILLEEISKIVGTALVTTSIEDGLVLPWAFEEGSGMIYYARHKGDSIYDYCGFQVSSLGMNNEKFYMGESDGVTYAMGYPEDENWDDTYILILDNKNKESLTID